MSTKTSQTHKITEHFHCHWSLITEHLLVLGLLGEDVIAVITLADRPLGRSAGRYRRTHRSIPRGRVSPRQRSMMMFTWNLVGLWGRHPHTPGRYDSEQCGGQRQRKRRVREGWPGPGGGRRRWSGADSRPVACTSGKQLVEWGSGGRQPAGGRAAGGGPAFGSRRPPPTTADVASPRTTSSPALSPAARLSRSG